MKSITTFFCPSLARVLGPIEWQYSRQLQEIRLRIGRPLMACVKGRKYYITGQGELTESFAEALVVEENMLQESLERMSQYSIFAFEEEIRQGYMTIEGGHRVGITGQAITEGGMIRSIRNPSALNVRLAHEVLGCADRILPLTEKEGSGLHTLIVSPPGCGKTTLLRDLIRQLSDTRGRTVGVADERSEIGGCYRGIPQCDIGRQTDILDRCPKAEGMQRLLRTMNPQVIAVDELGDEAELWAARRIAHAGVQLICTAHGRSLKELRQRPGFESVLDGSLFERIILLSARQGVGTIEEILSIGASGGKER